MSKLGILLACEHYPNVDAHTNSIDAQLRHWLISYGTAVTKIEVYTLYAGELPRQVTECDAWIVSGVFLGGCDVSSGQSLALRQFLQAADSFNRTVYAVNHGEHILHNALAAFDAEAPKTPKIMRSIQNPFRSFHNRYTLHRFNPRARCVESLKRPDAISTRGIFAPFRQAA